MILLCTHNWLEIVPCVRLHTWCNNLQQHYPCPAHGLLFFKTRRMGATTIIFKFSLHCRLSDLHVYINGKRAQRTSPSRSASGSGRSCSRGRSPSHSTSKPRPKRARAPKIYGTLSSEQQGAQHNRSIDLPVCGIGRSLETFGWVPQVTVGWAETCCATLWGCGMVHRGQNIVNSSKNPQFPPVMCALCPGRVRVVRAVRAVRALCSAQTPPVKPSPPPPLVQCVTECVAVVYCVVCCTVLTAAGTRSQGVWLTGKNKSDLHFSAFSRIFFSSFLPVRSLLTQEERFFAYCMRCHAQHRDQTRCQLTLSSTFSVRL